MRRYRVRLPATVLRYYRAFIIVDSIILQLAPSVNMVDEIRAFFAARRRESTLAKLTAENYLNAFLGYQLLLLEAPRVLSEIADLRLRAEAELREAGRDFRRLGAGALRGVGVFARRGPQLHRIGVAGRVAAAAVSPDGGRIAVVGVRNGSSTVEVDGKAVFNGTGVIRDLAWSPDGRWLLLNWRGADQWIFLRTPARKLVTVSNIRGTFGGGATIAGWCCP